MKKISALTLLLIVFLSTTFACFSQEKEFNPKPASASVYNLGLKSYEQGDLESAITFFKRAIDIDSNFVDAYYNLGAIYKKQGNLPLAINSFQKAIDINLNDTEATFELASCYFIEKNYEQAKRYFSSLPADFPKYNEVKKNLLTINQYLATKVATQSQGISEQPIVTKQANSSQPSTPEIQAQLLVDTLTKPTKETFKDNFRIVSSNFNGPTGIARDSKSNIYIADFTKDAIERISSEGKRETFIEKVGIKGPIGLAVDENDNVYVANYNGDSIIKITQNKDIFVLVNQIAKPYYLFYDTQSKKLFATAQGNDSLVEIDTANVAKQPITSRQ